MQPPATAARFGRRLEPTLNGQRQGDRRLVKDVRDHSCDWANELRRLADDLEYADTKGKHTMTKETTKAHAPCTWESGGSSETDKDAVARAEQLVKDAFRIFVQGTRLSPQDCLGCRAQIAIRHFAGIFYEQAVAYGLDADLKITLDLLSQGLEDDIPDDLRELWAKGESNLDCEPWVTK